MLSFFICFWGTRAVRRGLLEVLLVFYWSFNGIEWFAELVYGEDLGAAGVGLSADLESGPYWGPERVV